MFFYKKTCILGKHVISYLIVNESTWLCAPSQAPAGVHIFIFFEGGAPMPNIKSAKKRVKVIEAKTLQNQIFKTQLRTIVKKYSAALEAGDKAAATEAYKAAVKKIDQAAARGIIHKNAAAHKKSQFTLKLNNLG